VKRRYRDVASRNPLTDTSHTSRESSNCSLAGKRATLSDDAGDIIADFLIQLFAD